VVGRIYCSAICPAGVLQDIINRLYCIGKKKKNGIWRFSYRKPYNVLRYSILGLTAVSVATGFSTIAMLLDPYSNFGRIATNIFRPIVIWINNISADQLAKIDNYTLYHITLTTVKASSLTAAVVALLLFVVMTALRGRLFCNTICPVGALLSIVSRYSLFRISFNGDKCVSCGACSKACKAEAIDFSNKTVDASRCVDCFNCVSTCPKDALSFKYAPKAIKKETNATEGVGVSRRSFIATSATIAAAIPAANALAERKDKGEKNGHADGSPKDETLPITPPGSLSLEHFKEHCTGCQLCVARCPNQVLKPTALQYGLGYMLKPEMNYNNSYCNYECVVCSNVCPVGAIRPITKEEKITIQIGVAHFHKDRCVVYKHDQDCGACAEHCPLQAVHMVPYKGTLTIPEVNPDLCVGCGGCESICPVRPERAIVVEANAAHKQIEPPKQEEVKDIEVTDFGF
jgi:ferredoxin